MSTMRRRVLAVAGRPTNTSSALVTQSARTTLLNVAGLVATYIVAVTLTRVLGRSGYGAYVYAFAWATPLAVAAQLGYSQLVVRNVAAYTTRQEWELARGMIRRSQRIVPTASVMLMLGAAAVGWRLLASEEPIVRRAFFIGLLLVPALALRAQREAVLRGLHRAALGRLSETVIEPTLFLGLLAGAWLLTGSVSTEAALLLMVAAVTGGAVAARIFISMVTPSAMRTASPRVDKGAWSRSARPLFLLSGLQVINQQMGILMLAGLNSVGAAAVFAVAARLSTLVPFLQNAVINPLSPSLARLHAIGDLRSLQRLVSKASSSVLVLSLPVALGLFAFAGPALGIFGGEFTIGAKALSILVCGEVVNVASGFALIILINTGEERPMVVAVSCFTAVKAALTVVLIGQFGLEGAALAQALGGGLQNLGLAVLVWRRVGVYSPAVGARFVRTASETTS